MSGPLGLMGVGTKQNSRSKVASYFIYYISTLAPEDKRAPLRPALHSPASGRGASEG